MADLPTISSVVAELARRSILLPPGRVYLDEYGDSAELSRELLGLIRSGRKRAGASLLWAHEAAGEPVPAVGDIAIVLDDEHRPALVTRVTGVEVVPFERVGAEYAALEGEGDGSLEYWRKAHWAFFSRECAALGRRPDAAMPVVCVVFEVLRRL